MLDVYRQHAAERAALGIPPLPLTAAQTSELCEQLKNPPDAEKEELLMLLRDRVPPGVDEAAYVKAVFLTAIAKDEIHCPLISHQGAIDLLGTMVGGYNVQSLVDLLKSRDSNLAAEAANALSKTLLVFDAFNDVLALSEVNPYAKQVIDAWGKT
ncbi:MAG: aconitate hydratase B, partial [Spirulinaceae cyanobacterium RM2_2_10]|nr:aconitate hydratase B [Spirulinaceae cyanobacterium RM2_2_10]